MLGEGVGQILSFIYTEIRGMIVYAFEGREEELLIHMELFLQIHSEYEMCIRDRKWLCRFKSCTHGYS